MREITYHKEGDYYIPDLYLAEDEYEKNYHYETDVIEKNPINENLKDTNPLEWVSLMNNYKYTAEEIIYFELIYC